MNCIKYTVLMSVYKNERAEYLRCSIESMIAQTIPPDEFLLVKDGPLTVELDNVIDEYVSKYPCLFTIIVNEKNIGLGLALARGIEKSRNEMIARMDSDDWCVPERCEKQLNMFDTDIDLGIVGSYEAEFIDEIDNIVSIHRVPKNNDEIVSFMRRRCALLHPTVMYKRSAVMQCGNYHSVILYEDYDLFARMIFENGVKAFNIQENLYYIRTSEDFYRRRGGRKYAKTVLRFKLWMLKKGYMSIFDFLVSGGGQVLVCLLPNVVRKFFYLKFLR